MFGLKTTVRKDDEWFQHQQIDNLKKLSTLLARHQSASHLKAIRLIEECLEAIDRPAISLLVIELKVSWLIREIGAMLSDKLLVFSDEEKESWDQLKSLSGSRFNIR